MTHHTEAERAEFELDWRRRHHPLPMNTRLRDDGRYGDHIIQGQFETWQAARRAPATPVPQGWKPGQPITEEMHVAACKVLLRAHGLDGTPQRMLNAMLAAAKEIEATHGQ